MQFTKSDNEIFQRAIDLWGTEEQMSMAIGECGEFLTLFGRRAQNRDTTEDWISEISDVIITMEQMARIFGYDAVQNKIQQKMQRLDNRINNYK